MCMLSVQVFQKLNLWYFSCLIVHLPHHQSLLILNMKVGRSKIRCYQFDFNLHFRSLFFLMCLEPVISMKFGTRFMHTLDFKLSLQQELCITMCVVRLKSKSMEEYGLKIKSYVSFIVYFVSVQLLRHLCLLIPLVHKIQCVKAVNKNILFLFNFHSLFYVQIL